MTDVQQAGLPATREGILDKLVTAPLELIERLEQQLPTADPQWVVNTRNDLIDIEGLLARRDKAAQVGARKAARITEWHMAKRWPVKHTPGRRLDDRPRLSEDADTDAHLWARIYLVGQASPDDLIEETNPNYLTQAAVIRRQRPVDGFAATSPPAPSTETSGPRPFRHPLDGAVHYRIEGTAWMNDADLQRISGWIEQHSGSLTVTAIEGV